MTNSLEHFDYLSDRVKLDRYRTAIEQLVRPEYMVLDLGCGTGVLGLMALRAGARKVFFVEHDPIIEVARQTVSDAGFSDRAEFFQANSFELTLPERVDVVVCDHVGFFGFDYGVLELLADARLRFLKDDGIIVPAQLELKLAPVESVECRKFVGQWQDGSVPEEFGWLGTTAANTKHAAQLTKNDLLADAATITTLQLGAEVSPYLSWDAVFICTRKGTLDGIAGWFDCKLFDDVYMTNSPSAAEALNRPQAFLPLESPVSVNAGDSIRATVMVRPLDNVIGWVVELPRSQKRFAYNTFNGQHLDAEALTRVRPERVARLNDRGHARQVVLSYCDGQRTVADVQELVSKNHPGLFPSEQASSSFVTKVLAWETSE